jgi:protease-4
LQRKIVVDATPPPGAQPPQPVVTAQVVRELPPRPRRSPWKRLLTAFFVLVFLGSVLLNLAFLAIVAVAAFGSDLRVQEKFVSHNKWAADKVAIITVEGVIAESEDGFVKRQIDAAAADKHVKAVVLRVDSPGGTVTGSDYIYHHLRKLVEGRKIPLVVSMGGMAASGGYYVSMAVGHEPDTIFAEPTTATGSIGVIFFHYNLGGLMEKIGAEEDFVKSGPLKDMGSLSRRLKGPEQKIFQALIDESFAQFKQVIRDGRAGFAKDPAALDKLATGQIFTAHQAKANGLIDQIGFVEDAVDRAIALAKLNQDEVKVVQYKPEVSLAAVLAGGQSEGRAALDLRALRELATPRAYYLCSWLPALEGAPKP